MLTRFTATRWFQAIRSRLGLKPSIVHQSLLGHNVMLRYNTIGDRPDYDEGWTYALLSQSSQMFDVGCNVGAWEVISCIENPARKIVAIDPNPKALSVAAENLFCNGFSHQVQFILGFVSDTEDLDIEFFTVGTGSAGSRYRSHARTASAKNSYFKARTTTLDRISRELNIIPDFVKIDVEGAETDVLNGAKELASRHQPRFIVEMHSSPEMPMVVGVERLLQWCQELSFDAYYLKEHRPVVSADILSHRGRCHLYLQPKGLAYPWYLKYIEQGASLEHARAILMSRNDAPTD